MKKLVTKNSNGKLELNLSKRGLTRVPEAVSLLTEVEVLDLSDNAITNIPESLSKLTNLKALNVNRCSLKNATNLSQLTTLEKLSLSCNGNLHEPQESIVHLKRLKELDLSHCGVTEMNAALTELTSLEQLNLSGNPIKRLPQGFSSLIHLKRLVLPNCGLTEIGTVITQLSSLEDLNLSYNPIERLPQGFSSLIHLRKLYLPICGLTEIGTDITQLTSLEELDLSGNPIKRLPQGFSSLIHLRKLVLLGCGVTEIGIDITQLTSLEELNFSGNPIKRLPQGFSSLINLRRLVLYNCRLTEIGTDITQLSYLEELNLSSNRIERLPQGFSSLIHLRKLYLNYCNLKELPLNLTHIKSLQVLSLFQNPLTNPLPEVCSQGIAAIFSYLSEVRLAKSVHQKVVLLGSSGAGKTSLARTLVNNKPSCVHEDDRTIVIDRIIWEPRTQENILSVSMTDFGGNDWYKVVYHLFMEENALFLLVLNLAKYTMENFYRDIGSWLNTLLTRVPMAVFKLVATHADKCTQEDIVSKCENIEENVRCIYKREGLGVETMLSITVISSETMVGISNFRDELLCLACQKGRVIPAAWLELYKAFQSRDAEEKPYFDLEEVKSIDKGIVLRRVKKRVWEELRHALNLPVNSETRLHSVLKFFHAIGTILWYENIPEVSSFVFHNPEYLTNLLKAIFSERLETKSLRYESNAAFKVKFTPAKFQQVVEDLLEQGIMSRDLLECLWKQKKLDEEVFNAMIHLFVHLDFCYPLSTDQEGQVTSLRFPWFLTEAAPEDASVQRILFGPPALECHRLTLEYEFLTICPPAMYEKFAVRTHRHIDDTNSRVDWKDGVYATVNQSCVVVHRINRPLETVISVTVEGSDVVDLWEVLKKLDKEMKIVMTEWPGMKVETWLVCPHCLQYGVRKPCKFPGKQLKKLCPQKSPYMTCKSDKSAKVPSCLVYPVKGKLT